MPIAKARLFGEMTVQRLVEELASVWVDDENHVLALLAGLLDEERQQRSDEGNESSIDQNCSSKA